MLANFDLTTPASLDEALETLADAGGGPGATPLAGGTNMLVDIRARRENPARLVWLGKIAALRGIRIAEGRVSLGGGTTMSDILRHPSMADCAPSLVASARIFGGQMVRNRATVAGNICSGSPAADVVPPLLSLDAEVCLTSRSGTRVVPLDAFYRGFKENDRRADELVTEVRWDKPSANSRNLFYKLALRKGDAITVAGVAVTVTAERGKCTAARIALGAVAPTVLRARQAEDMLAGQALTPELIDTAAQQAAAACNPIDDLRASADYRRHAVHMLTRRLVTQAWDGLADAGEGR